MKLSMLCPSSFMGMSFRLAAFGTRIHPILSCRSKKIQTARKSCSNLTPKYSRSEAQCVFVRSFLTCIDSATERVKTNFRIIVVWTKAQFDIWFRLASRQFTFLVALRGRFYHQQQNSSAPL